MKVGKFHRESSGKEIDMVWACEKRGGLCRKEGVGNRSVREDNERKAEEVVDGQSENTSRENKLSGEENFIVHQPHIKYLHRRGRILAERVNTAASVVGKKSNLRSSGFPPWLWVIKWASVSILIGFACSIILCTWYFSWIITRQMSHDLSRRQMCAHFQEYTCNVKYHIKRGISWILLNISYQWHICQHL